MNDCSPYADKTAAEWNDQADKIKRVMKGEIMNHTKGPWKAEHYTDHPHIQIYGKLSAESTIPQRIAYLQDHLPENKANAALIASAPELLSCLKSALDRGDIGNPWIIAARAAVAKAEGRE
jgi:hypothetical protein